MLIWKVFILQVLISAATAYQTYENQYKTDIDRLKCESAPHRTLYYEDKCHALSTADRTASFPIYKEVATSDITQLLRNYLVISKREKLQLSRGSYQVFSDYGDTLRLSTFGIPGFCHPDATRIGHKCFLLESRKSSRNEARNYCADRDMSLFHPHSDRDVKTVVELSQFSKIEEILVAGSWESDVGWKANDQFEMDYNRWLGTKYLANVQIYSACLGPENEQWRTGKQTFGTKLHLQNFDSKLGAALGYISVDSSNSERAFVCVSGVSPERVVVKTTTTTTTTTTKKIVCNEWTPWHPKCEYERCGRCLQQTRRRKILPGCPAGETYQMRNCYYGVCFYPLLSCEPPCRSTVAQGRHACQPAEGPSRWDCVANGCRHND